MTTELMKQYPEATNPDHAAELHRVAIETQAAANPEAQAKAEAHAAFTSHPHTMLNGILNDLRAPSALDVNGRIGTLQQAVARLVQVIIQHTPPPPEEHHGEEQHSRE
jgi:hypothetical protein